jgi:hypothetical protein
VTRRKIEIATVPTFFCRVNGTGFTISFIALEHSRGGSRPGYSHEVIINGTVIGFLAKGRRPSKVAAQFFLDRLLAVIDLQAKTGGAYWSFTKGG